MSAARRRTWLGRLKTALVRATRRPPVGRVDFGDLRRTTPISRSWGADRGAPLDRRYIERFLEAHAADVRGRVLEVKDARYTERFGGARVTRSDVVDIDADNREATIVDDLGTAARIPDDAFDCIVLTQTLQFVFPVERAVARLATKLRPGGVLLCTLPGISRIDFLFHDGDFWRFTPYSAKRLFVPVFPEDHVEVRSHGNVLAATAFLHGIAAEELTDDELDAEDPMFPFLVTVRARRPERGAASAENGPGGASP